MAILALFTGTMSTSQYEAFRKEVKWETDQPPGGIFHAASFDDVGQIHVADAWESAEAMQAFVDQRLMPGLKKLDIAPPDVALYPIHNLNAYPAIEQHSI